MTEIERADATMTAVRVSEFGGPDRLELDTVPRPSPDATELLVRVRAAGVNPIDWMVREGYTDEALAPELPYVPGWDLSGVVVAVGDEVSRFDSGDEVFGLVGMPDPGGTYAEYAAVDADEVVEKPENLDHRAAGALPMVSLTASRALFDAGHLQSGDRVLVHAAAGGVGHVAVQLATDVGAHVVGTASARNESFLRSLGVDEFVDYRERRFEESVTDVDLVLDAVGGETLERSVDMLAPGGTIVTLPEPPDDDVVERAADARGAAVEWFSVTPDRSLLTEIAERVDDGRLDPVVSEAFPLASVRTAHRESRDGHVRGKLVLDLGRDG